MFNGVELIQGKIHNSFIAQARNLNLINCYRNWNNNNCFLVWK